mgnify:FL=1
MNEKYIKNDRAKEIIDRTKVVLLDLDGTVYLGDKLIGNVTQTLAHLRAAGKKLVYLTNNSSRSDAEYEKKLVGRGIFDKADDVYSSGRATIEYLNANHAGKKIFLVATDAGRKDFEDSGVILTDEFSAEIAVLAYDVTLDFKKIRAFDVALKRGAYYVATHPDLVCPMEGFSMPDVGSFIQMFKTSSGRTPDVIIGKPNDGMGKAVVSRYNVSPDEVLMVGDRLSTDMAFAVNSDFNSLLVLSGETDGEMYFKSGMNLSLVFNDVNDLEKYL